MDEFVPKVVIKDANRPPWIDKEVLLSIRKKNRTRRRKAKLKDSINFWERFGELRRQVKKMVKFKKRSHFSKLSYSLRDNPRKFWSYYKTIIKTTRIPGVINHESVQATKPIDQANLFNVMFHSVSSEGRTTVSPFSRWFLINLRWHTLSSMTSPPIVLFTHYRMTSYFILCLPTGYELV